MAVVGALLGGLLGGFGEKPAQLMPGFQDLTSLQQQAVSGNLAALPGAEQLAAQTNQAALQQRLGILGEIIPGFTGMSQQVSKNLSDQLQGKVPQDVADIVKRTIAEGAQQGGYAGSQVLDFSKASAIGSTSFGIMQSAQDSLSRWTQMAAQNVAPQQFNAASMFLSPQQRIGVTDERTMQDFSAQVRNAAIAAAPDPFMSALTQAFIHDENSIMSLAGSAAGSAAGGSGGGL